MRSPLVLSAIEYWKLNYFFYDKTFFRLSLCQFKLLHIFLTIFMKYSKNTKKRCYDDKKSSLLFLALKHLQFKKFTSNRPPLASLMITWPSPPPWVRKSGIKSSGPYLGVELSRRLDLLHSYRQNYLQDGCGIQRVGCELC